MSLGVLRHLVLGFALLVSGSLTTNSADAQSPQDRERLMRLADTNGDGQVDEQERRAALARWQQQRNANGNGQARPQRPQIGQPQAGTSNPADNLPAGNRPAGNGNANRQRRVSPGEPGNQPGPGNNYLMNLLRRPELVARFDRDGDGELSPQERQAAMRSLGDLMQGEGGNGMMMERFDSNGDGELSQSERQAMRSIVEDRTRELFYDNAATGKADTQEILDTSELLERFDANGDGELNAQERAAARRAASGSASRRNSSRS